jgi:hypothetical protein
MKTSKAPRDATSGKYSASSHAGKLPTTFKVAVSAGKSFSVVRSDIIDSALGRNSKK